MRRVFLMSPCSAGKIPRHNRGTDKFSVAAGLLAAAVSSQRPGFEYETGRCRVPGTQQRFGADAARFTGIEISDRAPDALLVMAARVLPADEKAVGAGSVRRMPREGAGRDVTCQAIRPSLIFKLRIRRTEASICSWEISPDWTASIKAGI